jgi:hypothetical protein
MDFSFVVKGPAADATDALQPPGLLYNPLMKMIPVFPCNGAPVEWYWQVKTEILGGKTCPSATFPPQIPRELTRDRTRPSLVRGRRLSAWAMAQPVQIF